MSTKAVLSAPLPRVYEETQGGKVVPLNASSAGQGAVVLPIGGTDFNAEELAKISKETSKKLESEVLAPMERWMNAYALVQVRALQPLAAGGRHDAGAGQQTSAACVHACISRLLALSPPASSPVPCVPSLLRWL